MSVRRLFAPSAGQIAVKFALVTVVLTALSLGVVELARLAQAWLAVAQATQQAGQTALQGTFDVALCPEAAALLQWTEADQHDGPQPDCVVPDAEGLPAPAQAMTDQLKQTARTLTILQQAHLALAPLLQGVSTLTPQSGAEFGNPGQAWHFKITVCSTADPEQDGTPRFRYSPPDGVHFQAAQCVYDSDNDGDFLEGGSLPQPNEPEQNDFGGRGDQVVVAVDFNHPLLTPLLNQLWPQIALHAEYEGEVLASPEQFATPFPTRTITPTPTLTSTSTATATRTPSLTPTQTPTTPPTATPTSSLTPTQCPARVCTPTPRPTRTPTPTRTSRPTATPTETRTLRPTITPTITHTSRPTLTLTSTRTPSPTASLPSTP